MLIIFVQNFIIRHPALDAGSTDPKLLTMNNYSPYKAFVYFMTNKYNTVLYIGVTNNLYRRVKEHKEQKNEGFTARYNLTKLVYYECYSNIYDAIKREKQIKSWKRQWKNELVESMNLEWRDLALEVFGDE